MTPEQELKLKSLELSLQTFSLYAAEARALTFEEDKREGLLVSDRAIKVAKKYYGFLTTNP